MRYSTRTLLAVSTLVAVTCAGLVVSTPGWAVVFFTCTLVICLAAAVAAFVRRGAAQAFWIGFAVFAGGYFLIAFYVDGYLEYHPNANQFREPQLLTTRALMELYRHTDSSPPLPVATRGGFGGGNINVYQFGARTYVVQRSGADFLQIGQSIFTLLFGILGGWFGKSLFRRSRDAVRDLESEAGTP